MCVCDVFKGARSSRGLRARARARYSVVVVVVSIVRRRRGALRDAAARVAAQRRSAWVEGFPVLRKLLCFTCSSASASARACVCERER